MYPSVPPSLASKFCAGDPATLPRHFYRTNDQRERLDQVEFSPLSKEQETEAGMTLPKDLLEIRSILSSLNPEKYQRPRRSVAFGRSFSSPADRLRQLTQRLTNDIMAQESFPAFATLPRRLPRSVSTQENSFKSLLLANDTIDQRRKDKKLNGSIFQFPPPAKSPDPNQKSHSLKPLNLFGGVSGQKWDQDGQNICEKIQKPPFNLRSSNVVNESYNLQKTLMSVRSFNPKEAPSFHFPKQSIILSPPCRNEGDTPSFSLNGIEDLNKKEGCRDWNQLQPLNLYPKKGVRGPYANLLKNTLQKSKEDHSEKPSSSDQPELSKGSFLLVPRSPPKISARSLPSSPSFQSKTPSEPFRSASTPSFLPQQRGPDSAKELLSSLGVPKKLSQPLLRPLPRIPTTPKPKKDSCPLPIVVHKESDISPKLPSRKVTLQLPPIPKVSLSPLSRENETFNRSPSGTPERNSNVETSRDFKDIKSCFPPGETQTWYQEQAERMDPDCTTVIRFDTVWPTLPKGHGVQKPRYGLWLLEDRLFITKQPKAGLTTSEHQLLHSLPLSDVYVEPDVLTSDLQKTLDILGQVLRLLSAIQSSCKELAELAASERDATLASLQSMEKQIVCHDLSSQQAIKLWFPTKEQKKDWLDAFEKVVENQDPPSAPTPAYTMKITPKVKITCCCSLPTEGELWLGTEEGQLCAIAASDGPPHEVSRIPLGSPIVAMAAVPSQRLPDFLSNIFQEREDSDSSEDEDALLARKCARSNSLAVREDKLAAWAALADFRILGLASNRVPVVELNLTNASISIAVGDQNYVWVGTDDGTVLRYRQQSGLGCPWKMDYREKVEGGVPHFLTAVRNGGRQGVFCGTKDSRFITWVGMQGQSEAIDTGLDAIVAQELGVRGLWAAGKSSVLVLIHHVSLHLLKRIDFSSRISTAVCEMKELRATLWIASSSKLLTLHLDNSLHEASIESQGNGVLICPLRDAMVAVGEGVLQLWHH